jgi:DNA-binding transcriptional MerR regulator
MQKKKYFTIKEVSNLTKVKPHTLRYWESEFKLLRPMRRESGQRRYTQKDIDTIEKIKVLLYEKKYSIAGAKKSILAEKSEERELSYTDQMEIPLMTSSNAVVALKKIKEDLLKVKEQLEKEI